MVSCLSEVWKFEKWIWKEFKKKVIQNPAPLSPLHFRPSQPTSLPPPPPSLSLSLSLSSSAHEANLAAGLFPERERAQAGPRCAASTPRRPNHLPHPFLFCAGRWQVGPEYQGHHLPLVAPLMAAGHYRWVSRASPAFKPLHHAAVKPLFTLPPSIGSFPS
jgi:hypothetical protein